MSFLRNLFSKSKHPKIINECKMSSDSSVSTQLRYFFSIVLVREKIDATTEREVPHLNIKIGNQKAGLGEELRHPEWNILEKDPNVAWNKFMSLARKQPHRLIEISASNIEPIRVLSPPWHSLDLTVLPRILERKDDSDPSVVHLEQCWILSDRNNSHLVFGKTFQDMWKQSKPLIFDLLDVGNIFQYILPVQPAT